MRVKTFLQVAGNPIMRDVSAEGSYSRNLSFAQGIKGIGGTLSTYLIGAMATLVAFQGMGWRGADSLVCLLVIVVVAARTEKLGCTLNVSG